MLTDKELQSLRNLGNEAEAAADEIAELREAYALLFRSEGEMRSKNDVLRRLLAEASSTTRHHDYDWPMCLQREVCEALGPNDSINRALPERT